MSAYVADSEHMFTETLTKRVRRSSLLDLLTGPHGVDRYTELVDPTWTRGEGRARVVGVRRNTPRSVTLTLDPNRAFRAGMPGFRAGQHVSVTVEVDGRRRTRPYSIASGEGDRYLELTIGRHDGGVVSPYLVEHARRGLVVGLDSVGGEFTLPEALTEPVLLVSGGTGITPVMSMLRTLVRRGQLGDVLALDPRGARELAEARALAVGAGLERHRAVHERPDVGLHRVLVLAQHGLGEAWQ